MNTQVKDVGLVVFGIFLIISVYMTLQRVDKYIKVKAIDDCGRIARYEFTGSDGVKTYSPMEEVYKKCLSDKGY